MIQRVLDAFVRALGHSLLPRVIGMTLLSLLVMTVVALGLGYFFWSGAVEWMRAALASWSVVGWLDGRLQVGWPGGLAALLAPFALVALATPVIVLTSLVLLLPPLIWGWLTYRVMSFDALADYASSAERAAVFKAHRWPLLAMGIATGYMGAAPGIVWASGVLFAALFVVLVPLAIWIYTFVFVFSSLWFAHYCLDALVQLRAVQPVPPPAPPPAGALPPADARTSITDVPWRDANRSS